MTADRRCAVRGYASSSLLAVFALLLWAAGARAGELDGGTARTYSLDPGDVGVPTTKWLGAGYARGPVRVLILEANPFSYSPFGRRLVEFREAFGFEVEYAFAGKSHGRYGSVDNARILRLLAENEYDCLLVWTSLPSFDQLGAQTKYQVLSAVADKGMGLVCTGRSPAVVLREDRRVPAPVKPVFGGIGLAGRYGQGERQAETYLQAYQVGKGCALDFQWRAFHRYRLATAGEFNAQAWSPECRIDGDYALAELGRAVLYAAGKAPEITFLASPPAVWALPLGTEGPQRSKWVLEVDGPPRDLTVQWRLRDLTGKVTQRGGETFEEASGRVACPVVITPPGAGHHYLDVFVDSPRGRETYGYSAVVAPMAAEVTVSLAAPAVEPGEPIAGTVRLAPVEGYAGTPPVAEGVRVELMDENDRVLAAQRLGPGGGEFAFDTTDLQRIYTRVAATLVAGTQPLARGHAVCNLLWRRQDRWSVVMWGAPRGPYAHWAWRKLWRTGVNVCMDNGSRYNMPQVPFSSQLKGEREGKPFRIDLRRSVGAKKNEETGRLELRPVPWNDEERFREEMLPLTDWVKGINRTRPVYVNNLWDEGPHAAKDMSEAGIQAYQAFLREEYRDDLALLNTEWQSAYESWDEVAPLTNDEAKAHAEGNHARWSDRKHFAEVNFGRTILRGFTEHWQAVDPQVRVGFEGSGKFGMDFDALFEESGFWCPYDGLYLEMVRSIAPADYIYGFWIGYTKVPEAIIHKTWRQVVNGAPSVWFWMFGGWGKFSGWLARNDMPYPSRQALIDECIQPLRQGLGDLLIQMDSVADGFGLYYSVAAANAGEFHGMDFNAPLGAATAWHNIIQDCGIQWLYTTKKRLLAGRVEKDGIRVLILPFIQALGQDEVAALRRFVEAGGTVIADLRPGVLSGHCRPVEHGPAEALFGIERTAVSRPVRVDGEVAVELAGQTVPLDLYNNRADGGIALTTGKALAAVKGAPPLFIVNEIGKGRAILLNFHVTQYNGQRALARGRRIRDFFRPLATALGIEAKVRVSLPDGAECPLTEINTWQSGSARLYALLKESAGAADAVLHLPKPAFAYEFRGGGGKNAAVALKGLKEGYARFVAVYPFDPGAPAVEAKPQRLKAGGTAEFALSMTGVPTGESAVFSYHTRLLSPQGAWLDIIPWSVQGEGGRATVRIRFAQNDPPGDYRLEVREVTTGRTAVGTVTVE